MIAVGAADGDMQDQSTPQLLTGMIDFGLTAEQAVTAPQFGTDRAADRPAGTPGR